MIRRFILLGEVVLTLGLCGSVWAGQSLYPYPCATPCTPNTLGFGYFPTRWRQWPGEQRLEQTNPRAVGAERLPTPEGREQVMPPPAALPGQPPAAAPEGEILPPGGSILPPQQPDTLQELPAEPKTKKPSKPPTEQGLPGLPPEPNQGPLPALPSGGLPLPELKPTPEQPTPEQPKSEQPKSEQPKSEQPKSEQPKPKKTIKSKAIERSEAAAEPKGTSRIAMTAGWSDQRQAQTGTVVLLVDRQDQEQDHRASVPHRANAIGIAASASPAHKIEAAAFAAVEAAALPDAGNVKLAPPTVALNGYCPVELVRNGRWTPGDLRWTVVYDGCIYRLSGSAQRREFQANPGAFAPAYSGNDPVLLVDKRRTVPGQLTYCATYDGRLYVFASAATQSRFNKDPQRYVAK